MSVSSAASPLISLLRQAGIIFLMLLTIVSSDAALQTPAARHLSPPGWLPDLLPA